jgi:hypothetical protein
MQQLNTIPIENFLQKARIASKSGQKVVNLSLEEAQALSDSLSIVMMRLTGQLDAIVQQLAAQGNEVIQVDVNGGGF